MTKRNKKKTKATKKKGRSQSKITEYTTNNKRSKKENSVTSNKSTSLKRKTKNSYTTLVTKVYQYIVV